MRFLLAIMAMALFAISVGCEAPSGTTSTDTPATEAGSSTADAGETQMVSLKLPGMT